MKKLDISNITGTTGQRVKSGSLEWLQLIPKEIAQQLIREIRGISENSTTAHVLWGVYPSISGGTFTFSKGAIYYNGEIYTVAAATVTPSGGQVPVLNIVETPQTDSAHDPVILSDGSSVNVHLNRVMQWSAGASGSGVCDYSNLISDLNQLTITSGEVTITGGSASVVNGTVYLVRKGRLAYLYIELFLTSSSTTITNIAVDFSSIISLSPLSIFTCEGVGKFISGSNIGLASVNVTGTVITFKPFTSTFPAFTSGNKLSFSGMVLPT